MKILLTGASGQLGNALTKYKPNTLANQKIELIVCSRQHLNLADSQACQSFVEACRPDWIINAGAYTDVDKAEHEIELTYAINTDAPAALAKAQSFLGGRMLHISTDFVFSGSRSSPYPPDYPLEPLGIYGLSKAAGEAAVFEHLGSRAYVLRTSWLYGPVGKNFFLTMLKLHSQNARLDKPIRVISDQVGCPTNTGDLAKASWRFLELASSKSNESRVMTNIPSILHWCDAGVASWYDFACAIGELGVLGGLFPSAAKVEPISTSDYPSQAKRPCYSILDCNETRKALDLEGRHWRDGLKYVIKTKSSL